jgi:hypothetical protein
MNKDAQDAFRAAVKEVDAINSTEVLRLQAELSESHALVCRAVARLNMQVIRDQETMDLWNDMRKWLVAYADKRAESESAAK